MPGPESFVSLQKALHAQDNSDYSSGFDPPTPIQPQLIIQALKSAGWSDIAIKKYLENVTTTYEPKNTWLRDRPTDFVPGGDYNPGLNRVRILDSLAAIPISMSHALAHEAHHFSDSNLIGRGPIPGETWYRGPGPDDIEELNTLLGPTRTTRLDPSDVVHWGTKLEDYSRRNYSLFPREFSESFFPYLENPGERSLDPYPGYKSPEGFQREQPWDINVIDAIQKELYYPSMPDEAGIQLEEGQGAPGWYGRQMESISGPPQESPTSRFDPNLPLPGTMDWATIAKMLTGSSGEY